MKTRRHTFEFESVLLIALLGYGAGYSAWCADQALQTSACRAVAVSLCVFLLICCLVPRLRRLLNRAV